MLISLHAFMYLTTGCPLIFSKRLSGIAKNDQIIKTNYTTKNHNKIISKKIEMVPRSIKICVWWIVYGILDKII